MTTAKTTATTKTRRQALGAFGEDVAARHLREQGMVVLDRNWRCAEGEIDLVLRDGPVLVVCCQSSSQLRNSKTGCKTNARHHICEVSIGTRLS